MVYLKIVNLPRNGNEKHLVLDVFSESELDLKYAESDNTHQFVRIYNYRQWLKVSKVFDFMTDDLEEKLLRLLKGES